MAFVAKALYRIPATSDLIRVLQGTRNLRRICGFSAIGKIPSESTFSRAFAEFAASELATQAHDSLVREYLADELLGHISRDSTAIVGREKPAKKVKEPKKPRKRGRPAKDEKREPAPLKRLDRQVALSERAKKTVEVYTWFSEGFDTYDLREAKKQIDMMS